MTAYDKDEALRLVAKARDEYELTAKIGYGVNAGTMYHMANQLEAAVAEVDRLIAQSELRGQTVADLAHELGTLKGKNDVRSAALRAEFETDDPAQIAAMSRMVISDRDRMQDALAAADPKAEAALAIAVLTEIDEGRPDTRVVQLAQEVLRLTARAQVAELEAAAMRTVVEAAVKVTMGRWVAVGMLVEAADAYTAGAEARGIEAVRIAGNAPRKENHDG